MFNETESDRQLLLQDGEIKCDRKRCTRSVCNSQLSQRRRAGAGHKGAPKPPPDECCQQHCRRYRRHQRHHRPGARPWTSPLDSTNTLTKHNTTLIFTLVDVTTLNCVRSRVCDGDARMAADSTEPNHFSNWIKTVCNIWIFAANKCSVIFKRNWYQT